MVSDSRKTVTIKKTREGFMMDGEILALTNPSAPFPSFLHEPTVQLRFTIKDIEERRRINGLSPTGGTREYERRDGKHGRGLYLVEPEK